MYNLVDKLIVENHDLFIENCNNIQHLQRVQFSAQYGCRRLTQKNHSTLLECRSASPVGPHVSPHHLTKAKFNKVNSKKNRLSDMH